MTSRTTRAAAIAVATAGLLLTPVGAASAQTVINRDTRGDVARIDGDGVTPAPDQVDGDVVRTRLFYAHRVGAVIRFADLRRVGDDRIAGLTIGTDEGVHRDVVVEAGPGHWGGHASVTKSNGDEVPCKGLTHKIDYKANTLTLRVPRSCLSTPRWVKVGVAAVVVTENADATETGTFDDALRDGPLDDDSALTMSRRIHRAT